MSIVFWSILAAIVSALFTIAIREYALRKDLLDIPNHRSSHQVPTPTGGGVAFASIYMAMIVWFWYQGIQNNYSSIAVVFGGLIIVIVGFLDDHGNVSRKLRLAAHLLAATSAMVLTGGLPEMILGGIRLDFGLAGDIVAIVGIVWLLNLYNFMDGIDGIAGVEAVTVALSASVILWTGGEPDMAQIPWLLVCVVAGFLIWNWPPARIFMGDVGSGFLGFTLGVLAIITSASGAINLWCWGILLAIFISDATVTLLRRMIRGDKWYDAHRCHAYQIASRYWASHLKVTLLVGMVNLIWLLPLAWFAAIKPEYAVYIFCVAYIPIVILIVLSGAGKAEA